MAPLVARQERFDVVGSTNDVVRGWLAEGTPEVCVAIADRQTAGRGRDGRTWTAPPGGALLLSLGFRPGWLRPEHLWRLAAVTSMAMAEAAETVVGLAPGVVGLKWPNDLVVDAPDGVRKLAGVLGESDGIGSHDPRAVIGIGVNGDWPREAFPEDLAGSMTSLRAVGGRPIDHDALLDAFLGHLEVAIDALREGRFDAPAWSERQVTTGRVVDLIAPDGTTRARRVTGVDADSGALLVEDRPVLVGEIRHVRLADPAKV